MIDDFSDWFLWAKEKEPSGLFFFGAMVAILFSTIVYAEVKIGIFAYALNSVLSPFIWLAEKILF